MSLAKDAYLIGRCPRCLGDGLDWTLRGGAPMACPTCDGSGFARLPEPRRARGLRGWLGRFFGGARP